MKKIMEKIGTFRGKEISQMNREELLEFAAWAAKRIEGLEKIAENHMELDLQRELLGLLVAKR